MANLVHDCSSILNGTYPAIPKNNRLDILIVDFLIELSCYGCKKTGCGESIPRVAPPTVIHSTPPPNLQVRTITTLLGCWAGSRSRGNVAKRNSTNTFPNSSRRIGQKLGGKSLRGRLIRCKQSRQLSVSVDQFVKLHLQSRRGTFCVHETCCQPNRIVFY